MRTGLHRDRAHRAVAPRRPVTRVDIHMPRPQAARAVVGIAVPADRCPADKALEVLGGTDEATGHSPRVGSVAGKLNSEPSVI